MDFQARGQRNVNPLELGLVQLPTRPTSIYTQGMRRAAIEACENGNLRLAADLTLAAITESAYCRGILADLVEGLWGLPRHWTGNTEMIAELTDSPERLGQFSQMFPQPDSIRFMSWGITLGVAPGQMRRKYGRPGDAYPISPDEAADWNETKRMRPSRPVGAFDTRVLHAWSPKYLRHQWWDDSWWMLSADGEFRIAPLDDAPNLDEYGRPTGLGTGNPDEWLMYTPYGRARPWEWGAWKSATQAFISERDAKFDRDRHAEVLAPMRVGAVPAGTTEGQRKNYLRQIKEMKRMGILILPPGLEYKLVESTGRVTQVYADIITSAHQEYAMITGAITTAEGAAVYAKGGDVQERYTRGILTAFGGSFFDCIHKGGLVPWSRAHYGSDDAPRPGCDAASPEDKKTRAETTKIAGEALVSIYEGAALAGIRPTKASAVKYLQSIGFEAEDIPAGEARAAKIDLAPTDKAKAFRVREVRAGEGYPPLGTIDAPDHRDDLTLAEMDALANPKEGAPPGGNHGDVGENGPLDEGEADTEPPTDEDAVALAAAMTAHTPPVLRCEHNHPNRCRACGVERKRVLIPGANGNPHAWGVEWRAILRGSPQVPAPAPSPTNGAAHPAAWAATGGEA